MKKSNNDGCINCKFSYLGYERMPCKICSRGRYHYGLQDKHVTSYKGKYEH